MAYLDLSRAVRGVDSLLRQRHGIHEFTDAQECIFRIALEPAARDVALSDGTTIREGDAVVALHLWNEHLPPIPPQGPNAAWANLMKRRMRGSLAAVAAHIERERRFDAVRGLHGAPPFNSRLGALQMVRTAERFGFDVIDPDAPLEWRDRIYLVLDSMFLWGLAYTFNPGRLRAKGILRQRYQLWISRRKLMLYYGSAETAPRPIEPH